MLGSLKTRFRGFDVSSFSAPAGATRILVESARAGSGAGFGRGDGRVGAAGRQCCRRYDHLGGGDIALTKASF